MPEEKKGRMARVYSSTKAKGDLPKRGERTSTHKERTKGQPKSVKSKMGR